MGSERLSNLLSITQPRKGMLKCKLYFPWSLKPVSFMEYSAVTTPLTQKVGDRFSDNKIQNLMSI